MEYHIRVNRYGLVTMFKAIYDDEFPLLLCFVGYAGSIAEAITYCERLPTLILSTNKGL